MSLKQACTNLSQSEFIQKLHLFKKKRSTVCGLLFGYLFSLALFAGATSVSTAATEVGGEGLTNADLILIALNAILPAFFFGELFLRLEKILFPAKRGEVAILQNLAPTSNGESSSLQSPAPTSNGESSSLQSPAPTSIEKASRNRSSHKSDKKYYLFCVGVLILCFLPVFLAYFPGPFAYDAATQLLHGMPVATCVNAQTNAQINAQINSQFNAQIAASATSYTTEFSLLHTLYLQFFYYVVGEHFFMALGLSSAAAHTLGIALSNLVQLLIFSFQCAFFHQLLYRLQVRKALRIGLLLLNGLLPTLSLMSISTSSYALYAGSLLMVGTALCYFVLAPEYTGRIPMLCCGILFACLLHKSAFFIAILLLLYTTFITVFINIKKASPSVSPWASLSVSLLGSLIFALLISLSLRLCLGAENYDGKTSLRIPYQQMATVYKHQSLHEVLSDADKEAILSYIPNADRYNPATAAPILNGTDTSVTFGDIAGPYFRLMIKYPGDYVQAVAELTKSSWYLLGEDYANLYREVMVSRSGLLLTGYVEGYEVVHISLLPPLEKLYERLYSFNSYLKIFPLRLLISPALYLWTILLGLFYGILQKKKSIALPAVLVLGILLSSLINPCVVIPYALPLILCAPCVWAPLYDVSVSQA